MNRRMMFFSSVVYLISTFFMMPDTALAGKQFLWVTNAYGNDVHVIDVATH